MPLKAVVTAGPTYEPIDPVRYLTNRSSGKQGYAIAEALANAGMDVTLISGPVNIPTFQHSNIPIIQIQTANEMLTACESALPADIFIAAAAVADWAPIYSDQKLKKYAGPPVIQFKENPDILKTIANHQQRPKLVIGFAAESENLIENAKAKLKSKSCDWIIANNISENIFGADENHAYLITSTTTEEWPRISKQDVAARLVKKITEFMQ